MGYFFPLFLTIFSMISNTHTFERMEILETWFRSNISETLCKDEIRLEYIEFDQHKNCFFFRILPLRAMVHSGQLIQGCV